MQTLNVFTYDLWLQDRFCHKWLQRVLLRLRPYARGLIRMLKEYKVSALNFETRAWKALRHKFLLVRSYSAP